MYDLYFTNHTTYNWLKICQFNNYWGTLYTSAWQIWCWYGLVFLVSRNWNCTVFVFWNSHFFFALLKLKKTLTQQVNDVKMNGSTTQLGVPQHVKRREKMLTTIILVTVFFFVFWTQFQVTFQILLFNKLGWKHTPMQFTIVLWISSSVQISLYTDFVALYLGKE